MAAAHVYLPLAAVSPRFAVSALLLGAVLVVDALASGLARRSFLSLTAAFVVAGAEWIARRSERALSED